MKLIDALSMATLKETQMTFVFTYKAFFLTDDSAAQNTVNTGWEVWAEKVQNERVCFFTK